VAARPSSPSSTLRTRTAPSRRPRLLATAKFPGAPSSRTSTTPASTHNPAGILDITAPPAIAIAVRAADTRTHAQLESLIAAGVEAGEWPAGTDAALAARLFTAGLYGLMAQWHLAPGSFSWTAAAAALADSLATVPRAACPDISICETESSDLPAT